jgi:hypothetical protein
VGECEGVIFDSCSIIVTTALGQAKPEFKSTTSSARGYLQAYQNGKDARIGISDYFRFYNNARPHQALGYRTPGEVFTSIPFEDTEKGVIECLPQEPIDTAGHYLNLAPLLS